MNSKTYADSSAVTYSYAEDGQLAARAWARDYGGSPLVTEYSYYPDSGVPSGFGGAVGELSRVTYDDGTPEMAYSYDRNRATAPLIRSCLRMTKPGSSPKQV